MDVIMQLLLVISAIVVFYMFVVKPFFKAFFRFRREIIIQQTKNENIVIRIDEVTYKGEAIHLVYEVFNNRFLYQATTADEIAKFLVDSFKNKNVICQETDGELSLLKPMEKA